MNYDKLFEHSKINGMSLKNRFVMAPMTTNSSMDYSVDEKLIDYYEARAKGGTGMIILEGQSVSNKIEPVFASSKAGTLGQWREWKDFTTRIKGYGAKLCVQLTPGAGRNAAMPGAVSASEIPLFGAPDMKARALSTEEVKFIVEAFGTAAAMAVSSGFDAIEIHAHTGYLMDQFMSECFNHRTDEYGGSFENRMRLPKEIIEKVRAVVGPKYPILFRVSVEHKVPGGRTVEDGLKIAEYLEDKGIDAFNIDDGSYEAMEWIFPPAYYGDAPILENAYKVKQQTKLPVMVAGNITPEAAADAVNANKVDYVLIGRGLIADPDYVNKVKDGRLDDLRPCIRCNEYCIGAALTGNRVGCSVNMQACYEKTFPIKKADKIKHVVVIGGGPGGMEAARIAAEEGHKVTLYEKSSKLGGQAAAAATAVFKIQLRKYLEYLECQIRKLGVDIVMNCEIESDSELIKTADEVIVAVGATPIIPKIPGIEGGNVYEVVDAHTNGLPENCNDIVIAGGGLSGCDYALDLAMAGKNATIVEMLDDYAIKANVLTKLALSKKFAEYGVNVLTGHKVLEFTAEGVRVSDKSGEEKLLKSDAAIVAIGTRPRSSFVDSILDKRPDAKVIGDCGGIGQVGEAVRAGFLAAWSI